MTNSIDLITKYIDRLDTVYKQNARTAIFEADASLVQETSEANVVKIAKIAVDGLGDYSRSSGYPQGDVVLSWETHTFSIDRGRMFKVDRMDDVETAGKAFGSLAGEFIRTKVVPEIDAYRFATIAGTDGISGTTGTLDVTTVKGAVDAAIANLGEAEVDEASMVLFVTPTIKGLLESAIGRELPSGVDQYGQVINRYNNIPVISVPQTRFYTVIDLLDGKTTGQTNGGYSKHTASSTGEAAGENINFILMDARSVFAITKNRVGKIVTPEENQNEDGWRFFFRCYHDMFVLKNKKAGIYCHHVAPAAT